MTENEQDRAAQAYLVWCSSGRQSDTKTAELTGIPLSTIGYYRRRDRWSERWQEAIAPEADVASDQARVMLRAAMPIGAQRLLRIIGGQKPLINANGDLVRDGNGDIVYVDEADHRDAIAALKLLMSYNWGDPRNVIYEPNPDRQRGPIPAAYTVTNGQAEPLAADPESIEAAKASVMAMIEETVQAVNTRTRTRPGRSRV